MTHALSSSAAPLIGAARIAGHLGITPRAVYHLVDRGRLPVFRLGAKICARPETLARWMARQEAASEAGRADDGAGRPQ